MQHIFEESKLRFSFDAANWEVIKYDGHPNHARIKLKEHKAIDFLAVYNSNTVVMFEVKNLRKHRLDPETQARMSDGAEELTTEIAQKVRDSLAGILGAGRSPDSIDTIQWNQFSKKIIKPSNEMFIVAWVESDSPPGYLKKRNQVKSTFNIDKLKQKLKWLNVKVSVSNVEEKPPFEGLSVTRLSEQ